MDNRPRPAARPKRESEDNRHSSFSGALEELRMFRKTKSAATEDDNVSVDQSVQTWDPANAPRRRMKPAPTRRAPTNASNRNPAGAKSNAATHRKGDGRSTLVNEVGVAKVPMST